MARQEDIESIKLLKSKKQLLKDIDAMEKKGLNTAFDRLEVEKEIAALEKKIADTKAIDAINMDNLSPALSLNFVFAILILFMPTVWV